MLPRRLTLIEILAAPRATMTGHHRPLARVYYFRRHDRAVEIGTTEHLNDRMRHLRANPGDALLATEPAEEAARHCQFAEHALGGERFSPSPELERHMTALVGAR